MSDFFKDCENTILKAQELLAINPEWVERFAKYGEKISSNLDSLTEMKAKFNQWAPLYLYMNVSEAKSKMTFSLRYSGQDVAKLKVKSNKVIVSTDDFVDKNKKYFQCDVILNDCEWRSNEAKKFRKYFSGNPSRTGKGKKEHGIESILLTEFSETSSLKKGLLNIQPVKFANIVRFQMPTAFKASKKGEIQYSGSKGGGIDILSHIGNGKGTKLCIMELKDENKLNEPPTQAILQGLVYATFIRELLRSKGGQQWWKLFGFGRPLPKRLNLYVASVMPSLGNDDISFVGAEFKLGTDRIHLGALYFTESSGKIVNFKNYLSPCK